MKRSDAYRLLSFELEALRQRPFDVLASMLGTVSQKSVSLEGEIIKIELEVCWQDHGHDKLVIKARANGPSCWSLERLEEEIIVARPEEKHTDGPR